MMANGSPRKQLLNKAQVQQVQISLEEGRLQKTMDPTDYQTGLSMWAAIEKPRYN